MQFLPTLITSIYSSRIKEIENYKFNSTYIQNFTLFDLLNKASNTFFGKKYNFNKISTLKDFQNNVPIHCYDDLKSYIEKMLDGEKDILWPGRIKWFAKSSGTTSDKSKFIPISDESLNNCHYRAGKDVLLIFLKNCPDTNILSGKALTLGGSHKINKKGNTYYGDLSAILIENLPFWTEIIKAPPKNIALIENFEEKIDKIAKTTIDKNITYLIGVPSWNLVLIKHILSITGKNNLLEVWPNLELFIHGGVSFVPYINQFKKLIPSDKMKYLETYNASEGFFAIQDNFDSNDMLLMLDYGIFYEFVPLDKLDDPYNYVYTLDEVETGVNYALIITTNGGLWRYIIGDTIMFTSIKPYKIKITGRTKHFINVFGEEVMVDNTDRALEIACKKTNASIIEYTVAPVYMGENNQGCHEWIIEFEKEPEDLELFKKYLDEALMSINSDYEAKRYKNITLKEPIIHKARKNLFYDWLKNKGKLGGQNKVPRLSNERLYLEELLILNNKNF